jgi:hypothetical protein
MKTSELSNAKNFNADLVASPVTLTINGIERVEFERDDGPPERKWVLQFDEDDRGCVLNVTRTTDIEALHGDDTDDWMGKRIELYQGQTMMAGKKIGCVSVRAAGKEAAPF